MKTIKVNMKDLPLQKLSSTSSVLDYCRSLKKQGVTLDSRIEFYRDIRPLEFDFAVTNLGEYLKERPGFDL